MDHREIEDQDMVERYLLGQLSATDAERFEAHYLGCPLCLDQLEVAEELLAGAKEAAATAGPASFGIGEPPKLSAAKPASQQGARVLGFPLRPRYLLAAAALLTMAILAPLLLQKQALGPPAAVLDLERGGPGAATTRLQLPPEGSLVLALQLSPPLAESYSVELYPHGASQRLWRVEGVEPKAAEEILIVAIPRSAVPPGEYQLRLAGNSGGTYRFATLPTDP